MSYIEISTKQLSIIKRLLKLQIEVIEESLTPSYFRKILNKWLHIRINNKRNEKILDSFKILDHQLKVVKPDIYIKIID